MELSTSHCPRCKSETLVYQALSDAPGEAADALQLRCMDCDTRLDRFGIEPELTRRSVAELRTLGYRDLDRPAPVGRGGCFETRGCEGCSKIDTRPW